MTLQRMLSMLSRLNSEGRNKSKIDGLVYLGFNAKKMSTIAQCGSGYGQGTDTTAVLTNRSKYITIIGDEPYYSRHSRTFPSARHRKGTRPMHTTTLTYEVKPIQTSYVSCMKAVSKYFLLLI